MDFGDWGWTDLHDSTEADSDEIKGFAFTQLSGLLFLLDCSPSMLVKGDGGDSSFGKCIRCIKNVCQRKVINSDKDMFAIVMYGLDKSSSDDGKAIYVYQDMGQLNIKRITDLEEILEDPEKFVSDIGHSDNYDISEVYWVCSKVFANCKKTFGEKRILMFTDNDNPHSGDTKLTRKAAAKATDLRGDGIELELLPLRKEGAKFDMEQFYSAVLYEDKESEPDGGYPEPSERFEDLLSRVYRKEHKRRAMGRIPFKFGQSTEMSVGVYSLCRRATAPSAAKMDRASNSEVKTMTRIFNKETGDDIMPQDIMYYQEYAGKRICLNQEEVKRVKDFSVHGLKIVGFKKISDLKLHLHVKPSHFIYPDETTVKGSSKLFTALLSRCLARKMAPVCWYRPRSNSPMDFVYLLPQAEEKNDNNEQTTPPGFHVIFAPYKEDMRELDMPEETHTASEEQVDKCKAMVKKLSFPYSPSSFDNPALQKFYANLEAMALNKDCPEEVTDYTIPDTMRIDKKVGKEAEEFSNSVFPSDFKFGTTAKRSAPTAKGSAAASKKAKADNAGTMSGKELAEKDKLGSLTVAQLKELMTKECIKTQATRKADIIDAIKQHYGM